MKNIVSESSVNPESARKGTQGGTAVGQTSPHTPSYHGVNQVLRQSKMQGAVSFGQALAATSQKILQAHETLYQGLERDSLMTGINDTVNQKQQEFIESNPSGKGLTEHITREYRTAVDEAASRASSPDTAAQIKYLGQSRLKTLANSAFQKENQMTTAYSIDSKRQTIESYLNYVRTDPDGMDSYQEELRLSLEELRLVLPDPEFRKYTKEVQTQFFVSYGIGYLDKHPEAGVSTIDSDLFKHNLPNDQFNYLLKYAQNKTRDREVLQKEFIESEKRTYNNLEQSETDGILARIMSGSVNESEIEANDILSSWSKRKCREALYKKRVEDIEINHNLNQIAEKIKIGEPLYGIESKFQEIDYRRKISALYSQHGGANQVSGENTKPSFIDKALIAKHYTSPIHDLTNELVQAIKTGTPEDAVSAAAALKYLSYTNSRVVGNTSPAITNFVNTVTTHAYIKGIDTTALVESSRERYFAEKSSEDAEVVRKKISAFLKEVDIERFKENHGFKSGFWGSLFNGVRVGDRAQFERDFNHEFKQAIYGGAESVNEAESIAAERLKDYWRVENGDWLRNPLSVTNPTLSPIGAKNMTAQAVKIAVDKLKNISYPGAKFKLVGEPLKPFKYREELLTKDLTTSENPEVIVNIGGHDYKGFATLESIPTSKGYYTIRVDTAAGVFYVPNSKNPLKLATIKMGG